MVDDQYESTIITSDILEFKVPFNFTIFFDQTLPVREQMLVDYGPRMQLLYWINFIFQSLIQIFGIPVVQFDEKVDFSYQSLCILLRIIR